MGGGLALVPVALSFGLAAAIVGRIKGSSFFIWFLIGTFVPLLGLLCALLYRYDRDELRRECPNCGRIVKLHDAICTQCGAELDWPDVAIAPESAVGPAAPR